MYNSNNISSQKFRLKIGHRIKGDKNGQYGRFYTHLCQPKILTVTNSRWVYFSSSLKLVVFFFFQVNLIIVSVSGLFTSREPLTLWPITLHAITELTRIRFARLMGNWKFEDLHLWLIRFKPRKAGKITCMKVLLVKSWQQSKNACASQ